MGQYAEIIEMAEESLRRLGDEKRAEPPKHKDWDRRFQCGAVWVNEKGDEAVITHEYPGKPYVFVTLHGIESISVWKDHMGSVFTFLRIDPPTSFINHVKGIGVSAEPPESLAYQDQYGDEDGL